MAAFIHGLRVFSFTRCDKAGQPVLAGASGMHLHSKVQKAAECRGISPAVWMTEKAKERLRSKSLAPGGSLPPHDGPAPNYDCSCGFYFYRTMEAAKFYVGSVYAHVTCLERTILHSEGGRTTQYSVDYFLALPQEHAEQKVYLPFPKDESTAKGPAVSFPVGAYGYASRAEERLYAEVLEEIALSLGIPILERDDLQGCPVCLVTNGWRDKNEISERMKREWFGMGYKA